MTVATHDQIRLDAERVIHHHWAGQRASVERVTILANHCLFLLDENKRLETAAKDALDSLGAGPMREGYAYSVLAAALGEDG